MWGKIYLLPLPCRGKMVLRELSKKLTDRMMQGALSVHIATSVLKWGRSYSEGWFPRVSGLFLSSWLDLSHKTGPKATPEPPPPGLPLEWRSVLPGSGLKPKVIVKHLFVLWPYLHVTKA